MKFKIIKNVLKKDMENFVHVLKECDNDFYRPLSSTVMIQGTLEEKLEQVIKDKSLKNTEFVCILTDFDDLIGYTMMNVNYDLPVKDYFIKSNYISLTVISPHYRNNGYASKLYYFVEENYKNKGTKIITRRTWSLNHKQMYLNQKLGYQLIWTDLNHKDINVDSLYYMKKFE